MKFTVAFIALLSISSVLTKRVDNNDPKDKREAAASYPSTSGHYPSSSSSSGSYQVQSGYQPASYQPQQLAGHGDAASAISVGAGYSIGGAKPTYNFGGHGSGLEAFQSGGQSIKLAPITLQPNQGLLGTDLSQIMSQLQHSLNSGALTLQPSSNIAEFHVKGQAGQDSHGQLNYGSPNLQQYVLAGGDQSAPSYSAGTKGLSSYGSTGPVLFSPSAQSQGSPVDLSLSSHGAPQSHVEANPLGNRNAYGLSLGAGHAGSSEGLAYGSPSGISLGSLGHSYGGLHLGSAGPFLGGISLGGSAGHSFGGSGHSLGGSVLSHGIGHSLGAGNSENGFYKVSKYGHASPGKSSFKPSAYLGSSVSSESGLSGLSHGVPYSSLSGGHSFGGYGSFGGSSKAISPLFTKPEGHHVFDTDGAYSNAGDYASPPATTYGFPTAAYPAGAAQSVSSAGPQYYSAKYPSNFKGHFSYKVPGASSLSAHSSGHKFSLGGQGPSARYSSDDSNGAYSENTYDTIKYSEEFKPLN